MTYAETNKDEIVQYHRWKSTFTFTQRLFFPFFKGKKYGNSWEYFMVNIYIPR